MKQDNTRTDALKQWKEIERLIKQLEFHKDTNEYYQIRETLKLEVRHMVELEFCWLPKPAILLLFYYVYRFNAIPLHRLGMRCEKQHQLLTTKS